MAREKTLPTNEVRNRLGVLIDAARHGSQHTIITKNGTPAAVLVSYDWYLQHRDNRGGDSVDLMR